MRDAAQAAGELVTGDGPLDLLLEELRDVYGGYAPLETARRALTQIMGERAAIEAIRAEAVADRDTFLTGLLRLNRQREDFGTFMRVCRGEPVAGTGPEGEAAAPVAPLPRDQVATDPDDITLACTQAWQAQVDAEAGNWWQTLAAQVPPGILLLFLLATLGGLYRYNLRLAGFHHARADVLELILMGRAAPGAALSQEELGRIAALAEALAADKVEFGKGNAPSDQAVEIAKAVLSRG